MWKRLLLFSVLFLSTLTAATYTPPMEMPTVKTSFVYSGYSPIELRDESVYKYLTCEFRIENKGVCFGSGTLCYYDLKTNTGYIISCGHLFRGGEKTVFIDTWYKNGVKLTSPARYTAEIIGYSPPIDSGGDDISFLKFNPDWVPSSWFPIAKIDATPPPGTHLFSMGCDGAREVAAYNVVVVGMEGRDLITKENSPRHGRSGGGLVTPDGYFVGIVWGSSDPYNGTGTGSHVPLEKIYPFAKKLNLNFLLTGEKPSINLARQIPIVDQNGPQKDYPADYIPLP
jgi:hypothetical protein